MVLGFDYDTEHTCARDVEQRAGCGMTFEYAEDYGACRCCDYTASDDDSLGLDDPSGSGGDDDVTHAPSVTAVPTPFVPDDAWDVFMVSNCSDPTPAPSAPPTLSLAPTTPVCAHLGYENETCADPTLVGYGFGSEHDCARAASFEPACGDLIM
jgi:hypothetical protein